MITNGDSHRYQFVNYIFHIVGGIWWLVWTFWMLSWQWINSIENFCESLDNVDKCEFPGGQLLHSKHGQLLVGIITFNIKTYLIWQMLLSKNSDKVTQGW